ncbi:MAG: Na(+)-translocating NADH-quinone reductase subunit A [bacterium]
MIKIQRGLDLPINGEPQQVVSAGNQPTQVALLGVDYVGMRPTMAVAVGDNVKLGQVLFSDKKMPAVRYTAPGAGKVVAINRGAKRTFLSLVIQLSGSAEVTFRSYSESQLYGLKRDKVRELLLESGLWTSLRARPFSKVANPEETPHAIFVTAMDTNPLAPSVETILENKERHFKNGLHALAKLTDGKLYLCKAPGANIPTADIASLTVEEFAGPHPAGLVGTHIHFLDPVHRGKTVWHIGAQDVAAVGELFTTGRINVGRIVSLAGPSARNPRLIKTRLGANLQELVAGETTQDESRIISGSVLSGHMASDGSGFLGRYHQQISGLPEGRKKEFLGWLSPGLNLFSVKNIVLSRLLPGKKFNFTTSTNGGVRAIVPSGSLEKVMPLDILPLFLVRALAMDNVEDTEQLGALELDEEDLALCTFVCPSKLDYGPMLRRNLTIIEKEG